MFVYLPVIVAAVKVCTGKKVRRAKASSCDMFDYLHEATADFTLGCADCLVRNKPDQGGDGPCQLLSQDHTCAQNKLLVQLPKGHQWVEIRPRPVGYKSCQDLCENSLLGSCSGRCDFPHTELEQDLWKKDHEKKLVICDFIDDLLKSDLHLHAALTQLKDKFHGHFELFCKECHRQPSPVWSEKKRHQPLCEKGHEWKQPLLTFVTDKDVPNNRVVVTDQLPETSSENGVLKTCTGVLASLKELGFMENDIVKESKRLGQKQTARKKNLLLEAIKAGNRLRTVSSGSNHSRVSNDDDTDSSGATEDECSSSSESSDEGEEEEEWGRGRGWGDSYYTLLSSDEVQRQKNEDPNKFKECIITLEGTQKARCLPLDNSDTIEIRGRMNCGPSFTGDEVIVEVLYTEVLDTKQVYTKKTDESKVILPHHIHEESIVVTRGRVVAVTKRNTHRKSMKFLCVPDSYMPHLMRPLCGTAPKIHIIHDEIEERHRNTHNRFVPLHNKKLHLKRDVKLDAKSVDSKLFQVRYLKWGHTHVYPLGYASKVYHVGNDVVQSQKMLDLMYQLRRKDHKHVLDLQPILHNGIPTQWFDGRKDLTEELTVSIDPAGCRDVDDALSIKEMGDDDGQKQFEVGVHIADASRFVSQESNLDKEAQRRLFTYYTALPRHNHPMLPPIISEQFCSLQEKEKRLALSVIFLFGSGGRVLKKPVIKETVIKNKAQMSYHKAQEIITKDTGIDGISPEIATAVRSLYEISRNLRKSRMKGSILYQEHHWEESDIIADHDAHELVEEFMLLANEAIATYLMKDGSEIVPLRKQLPPRPRQVEEWESNNSEVLPLFLYFQRYIGPVFDKKQLTDKSEVLLLKTVYKELQKTSVSWREVASLVGQESLHPKHTVAMSDWYSIQNSAIVECPRKENKHFSLQKDQYTWFTSPMRRYVDVIVHRLVKSRLHGKPVSYTKAEIEFLCSEITKRQRHYKKYDKACKQLECAAKLQKLPVFMPGIIAEIDDDGMNFIFPHMPNSHSQKINCFKYSELSVDGKPEMEDESKLKEKCRLVWEKRIYEDTEFHPSARTPQSANQKEPKMLDPQQHSVSLSGIEWKKLQDALSSLDRHQASLEDLWKVLQTTMDSKKPRERMSREVTSEMKPHYELFRHHVRFGLDVSLSGVLQVQVAAKCIQGVLQPEPCLVNITPTFDICVLHKRQPVRCFADVATDAVKDAYPNVTQYRETWQPILAMESAYRSTIDSDPIFVNKVRTQLKRNNNEITGELVMLQSFCKKRQINLVRTNKEKEEEQGMLHYICLRYDRMPQPSAQSGGFAAPCSTFKNVWMGHAIIDNVRTTEGKNKDNMVHAKFTVNQRYIDPPECLYKKQEMFTVELLAKPLPNE